MNLGRYLMVFSLAVLCRAPLSSASELLPVSAAVRVSKASPGSIEVNARIGEWLADRDSLTHGEERVAYVEGYGPITGLDRWLSSKLNLEELNLVCVQLNDSDINAILALPKLTKLNLRGCRLSEEQLDRLRFARSIPSIELHAIVSSQATR